MRTSGSSSSGFVPRWLTCVRKFPPRPHLPSRSSSHPRPRGGSAQAVATLLIVIGCILAPLSVVAVWAKNQVTNTDRYVATVAPLADDPAIQNAVADRVTAEIFSYLDVVGITNQAVDALAERVASARRKSTPRTFRAVV